MLAVIPIAASDERWFADENRTIGLQRESLSYLVAENRVRYCTSKESDSTGCRPTTPPHDTTN